MADEALLRKAVDAFAFADDFSHAHLCAKKMIENSYDTTEFRALWSSAAMSIRRALANGQTMHAGKGGAVAKPFNREEAKNLLPEELKEQFDDILFFADKGVAHRQPQSNLRSVEVIADDSTGAIKLEGHMTNPTNEQINALCTLAAILRDEALKVAAESLTALN